MIKTSPNNMDFDEALVFPCPTAIVLYYLKNISALPK